MFDVKWHSQQATLSVSDDITVNPLFTALKNEPDLWGIVSSEHGPRPTVALPRPSTISSVDRNAIGMGLSRHSSCTAMHVLQPTDVPDVFRTLDGRTVSFEDGKLLTGAGFDFARQVDILLEEEYYTGTKCYLLFNVSSEKEHVIRLLLISRPFLGGKEPPPPPPSLENIEQYVPSKM